MQSLKSPQKFGLNIAKTTILSTGLYSYRRSLLKTDGQVEKALDLPFNGCLREAPPPEALRRAGASAKAGRNLYWI
jgi:hypothetical protein